MKSFLYWAGITFLAIGVDKKSEVVIACGLLFLAIDYSTVRIINAINKKGGE